jgi:glutathione S-transferase
MLTLYGVYRSRASRNIWLANELGIPFKHVPVIQAARGTTPAGQGLLTTQSPEFLKINPSGQIPSIEDDGFVMHQSLAINLYLARKHGGALAAKDAREDGQMTQWTLWASGDVEPHAILVLYHMAYKPEAERDPKIAAAAVEALKAPFAMLDKHLATNGGQIVGGRFTVADINCAEVIRYAMPAKALFEANPHVAKWLAACHARPAFKTMMAKREAEPV